MKLDNNFNLSLSSVLNSRIKVLFFWIIIPSRELAIDILNLSQSERLKS